MEPIGILQFLQSLLSSTTQKQDSTSETPPPSSNEKTPPTKDDNTDLQQNRSAQEAVLQFLDAHDKRASKWRK